MLNLYCDSCSKVGRKQTFHISFECCSCGKTMEPGETVRMRLFCDRCGKEIKEGEMVGDVAFFQTENHFGDEGGNEPEDYRPLCVELCAECMSEIENMIRENI